MSGIKKSRLVLMGLLVFILVFSNVFVYISLQGQINSLITNKNILQTQVTTFQSLLRSLNTTYLDYKLNHTHTDLEFNSLNISYQNYKITHIRNNTEYNAIEQIVNLNMTEYFVYQQNISHPTGYYSYWNFSISFAGYIKIYIFSSTSSNIIVEVSGTSNISYIGSTKLGPYLKNVSTFPSIVIVAVLPANNLQVRIHDQDYKSAAETVSIVYCY